jgi:hypothetical protein
VLVDGVVVVVELEEDDDEVPDDVPVDGCETDALELLLSLVGSSGRVV